MSDQPNKVPSVLAILPGFMPTTLMYIIKPFLALEAEGRIRVRIALEAYFDTRTLAGADLIVFCRNIEPRYAYVLEAVLERRIPYVYDLDDNLYEVPLEVDDGEYYRAPERTALLTRYLSHASLVRVYSETLAMRVRRINPAVRQVSSTLDWGLIAPPQPRTHRQVRIVYATSRRGDYLFPIFTPALRQALSEHPGVVEAHFWGYQPAEFKGLPGVHYRKFDPNYNAFLRRFSSAGFDIGLAPMLADDFHTAKTNTKFREYGACGIAGVYSDTPLYSAWVENEKTGMLVENTDAAWSAALQRLIQEPDLRARIAAAARERVRAEYAQERFQEIWMKIIAEMTARPQSPARIESRSEAADNVGREDDGPAPAPAAIWRQKIHRAAQMLRAGELERSLFNSRVHLNNVWWLFKINRLKRL